MDPGTPKFCRVLCCTVLLCGIISPELAADSDDRSTSWQKPQAASVPPPQSFHAAPDDELAADRSLHSLPTYYFDIDLDPDRRIVRVRQSVRWTNPGRTPTGELVFQVVPNNRPTDDMIETCRRTLESLRIDPRIALDTQGGRFRLRRADCRGESLTARFSRRDDTHLHVTLPEPVAPGESVSVDLEYSVSIPPVMGRLGQYKGVTNLLHWYPVLAVYQNNSWRPVPYIPWHQPWFNEAGHYTVRLRLPANERVVTGGHVVEQTTLDDGRKQLLIHGHGLRDFTIICSRRFREWTSEVNGTPLRVVAFPEHAEHAQLALRTAEEVIAVYESWFGPYPYEEFELAEIYFGWNGNESSGVVMIDERIFDAPKFAGRYLEHLISHEICHQWWYSAVGTNGYEEPWMDEGLVQWFTRMRMEDKYGPNPQLLEMPGWGPIQLPNIQYRALVHSGYAVYRQRGGQGASLSSLDDIGHLHNLFFLVYDRGARITGMIQHRLGRERFFEFMSHVFQKYRLRILTAADFERELQEFTGEDWTRFFDTWLRSGGTTDWKLEDVSITPTDTGYRTQARITQQGDIAEPVRIGLSKTRTGSPFRLATLTEAAGVNRNGVTVKRQSQNDWLVTLDTREEPGQVIVDPDGTALDSNPVNNVWKTGYSVRVSPVYSPVDEAALIQPWQQHSIIGGFGIDAEGRIGLRGSVMSSNRFRVSPFIVYTAATARSNDDHLSAGVDAIIYNFPSANWQFLVRYEQALLSTLSNDPGHQVRISLRRILQYTTSLIYPNLSYVDLYTRFGDNFFPDEDTTISPDPRVQNFQNVRALGVDFHIDTQMPYWDPDRGLRFDAGFEHGGSRPLVMVPPTIESRGS